MRQKETDLGTLANLEIGLTEDGSLTIPTTLIRGQKLGLLLRRLFLGRDNVASFDELPIPFRCVATDIGVVKPVIFSSGDLALAIRASMAVPGGFAPVKHEGKVLVDGGIVDNVPLDVARAMGVDRLIVVDVGQPLAPPETVTSGFSIMLQMISGMMLDRTAESIATLTERDIFIRPELHDITTASFPRAADGIDVLSEPERIAHVLPPELRRELRQVDREVAVRLVVLAHDDPADHPFRIHADEYRDWPAVAALERHDFRRPDGVADDAVPPGAGERLDVRRVASLRRKRGG